MSVEQQIASVIELGVMLMILWVLWAWLFQSYFLEDYRERLFSLRNHLFDYAADGNIDFNHPAYRFLEREINVMIRHAHRNTIYHVLASLLFFRSSQRAELIRTHQSSLQKVFLQVGNQEVRRKLEAIHGTLLVIYVGQVIRSSMWLLLVAFFVGGLLLVRKGLKETIRVVGRRLRVEQFCEIDAELGKHCTA